jgi:hypothetical protein
MQADPTADDPDTADGNISVGGFLIFMPELFSNSFC